MTQTTIRQCWFNIEVTGKCTMQTVRALNELALYLVREHREIRR
ncbi:MAG: hypothetical protein VW390_01890 [Gammaproteobacteria bacterium]